MSDENAIKILGKRLQELEEKIPVFLSKISDQQSKMQEIFSFPKDLAEIRLSIKSLSDLVKSHIEQSAKTKDETTSQLNSLGKRIDEQFKKTADLATYGENLKGILNSQSQRLSEIQIKAASTAESSKALATNLQKAVDDVKALQDQVAEAKNGVVSLRKEVSVSIDSVKKYDSRINDLSSSIGNSVNDLEKRMNYRLSDELSKIKQMIQQEKSAASDNVKSEPFLQEVSVLLKELDRIKSSPLAVVPEKFDEKKFDEKILALENKIAQVYVFLKKLKNAE